ncbi:MAG: hypothetical protein KKH20_00225, partial [Proteobacteria bacterium]|nr:hypothetical protein [Pseudomonadota bacterium]
TFCDCDKSTHRHCGQVEIRNSKPWPRPCLQISRLIPLASTVKCGTYQGRIARSTRAGKSEY